ncbi:MAG TPA: Mpo1-like protein, partial [Burkholderiaceae bacterium]
MRAATDLLSQYAAYHRDQRNIASHFIGVPMIVFAVGVLLARPAFMLGGLALSPAWIAFGLAAAWYLTRGSLMLGVAVSASVGALMLAAHQVAYGGIASWLGWG